MRDISDGMEIEDVIKWVERSDIEKVKTIRKGKMWLKKTLYWKKRYVGLKSVSRNLPLKTPLITLIFVQGEKLAFRIIAEMLQNDLKSGGLSLKDFEMDIDTKVL